MPVNITQIYEKIDGKDFNGLNVKQAVTLWNCHAFALLEDVYKHPHVMNEKAITAITKEFLIILKYTHKAVNAEDATLKEVLGFLHSSAHQIATTYSFEDMVYLLGTNSEQPEHNYSMVNRLTILMAIAIKNDVKIDL